MKVGWEEGEGAVKIVDGFEVEVTFVACRKGMMTADNSLGFIVYLQRKREERVHHGGTRRGKLEATTPHKINFFQSQSMGSDV